MVMSILFDTYSMEIYMKRCNVATFFLKSEAFDGRKNDALKDAHLQIGSESELTNKQEKERGRIGSINV